jgi:hypothetical protein
VRTPGPERSSPNRPPTRWPVQAAFVASAFAVFICGWLAMKTNDWRLMILYTALAIAAAVIATAVRRRG